eukprot:COSAG01_NODE_20760_length_936_cov_43.408602_1_plen_75_part_10
MRALLSLSWCRQRPDTCSPVCEDIRYPPPAPPPVSRAVVKRSRRKGRGVFAAAGGISAHRLACYYPAKVIADPGL